MDNEPKATTQITEQCSHNPLDVGFPPMINPWEEGYNDFLTVAHERLACRSAPILKENPTYNLEDPRGIDVNADTNVVDGFIQQLEEHLKVWSEPCLIRLSDILKKSYIYAMSYSEYQKFEASTSPERAASRRHYALPHSHQEGPDCECIFCRACTETLCHLSSIGISEDNLVQAMIDKVRQRTAAVLISQVKMCFNEEPETGLDERICYGFRNIVPPLVIMYFEDFFVQLYSIGADFCWEILKKLAIVVQYTPNYNSALQFLSFWYDCSQRLHNVVDRLEDDLACFNWKLKRYNLDLKTFFFHMVDMCIANRSEFQIVLRQCKRVVTVQRTHHPLRDNEIDTQTLFEGLSTIENTLSEATETWKQNTLPFTVKAIHIPNYNIFKISRLRNPFVPLDKNSCEAYEIIESLKTGTMELRQIEKEVIEECDLAEPIMDGCLNHPKQPHIKFHFRLYQRRYCLTPVEVNHFVKNSDLNFLRSHDLSVNLTNSGRKVMDEYLKKREANDLDTVEGELPPEIEEMLMAENRQHSRTMVRMKKQYTYDEEQGNNDSVSTTSLRRALYRPMKYPPAYSINGNKSKRLTPRKNIKKLILDQPEMAPRLLQYCKKGVKCQNFERSITIRHRYAFGGIPFTNKDTGSILMEAQRFDFVQELIGIAMQMGTGHLDPLSGDTQNYKYYIIYCLRDSNISDPLNLKPQKRRLSTEHSPRKFEVLRQAMKIHYDYLFKYHLITIEDSFVSPNQMQRDWGAKRQSWEARDCDIDLSKRCELHPHPHRKILAAHREFKNLRDLAAGKVKVKSIEYGEIDLDDDLILGGFGTPGGPRRRKVALASATIKGEDDKDVEHMLAISEHGQVLAIGRVSPPPPPPPQKEKSGTNKEKVQTKKLTTSSSSCKCPHGHGETLSNSVTSVDGSITVETTIGMGAVMSGTCANTKEPNHQTNHNTKQSNPPLATRGHPPAAVAGGGGQTKPTSKADQRPTRPGLPTSHGYTEKRTELRQKLERGKQELKKASQQEKTPANPSPPTSAAAQKKTKQEKVFFSSPPFFSTCKPPNYDDDIDELVNLIEGNPSTGSSNSRKGSVSSNTVDPKKAAKKARKKERKEQLRLEEENQRLAEEELRKREEEERIRKEEEEKEELARKKREKKKQNKKKKKQQERNEEAGWTRPKTGVSFASTLNFQMLAKLGLDGSMSHEEFLSTTKMMEDKVKETKKNADKKNEKQKGDDKKNKEIEKPKEEAKKKNVLPQVPAGSQLRKQEEIKSVKSEDNPIVTIRRHSNTPDANVTISVKGDNGEEDVLYTLVNGKVLRAEPVAQGKGVGGAGTSENGKKKKKKSKGGNSPILEDVGDKIHENGVIEIQKSFEDVVRISSSQSFNKPSVKTVTENCPELDMNNLNIPSGLTVTRLTQPVPPFSISPAAEQKNWDSSNVTSQSYSSATYNDVYINNQNVFTGNSTYSPDEEHISYGQQTQLFSGTGEFEEVVSNKKRRLRNKANKQKDDDESEQKEINGSLVSSMTNLTLNSPSNNSQHTFVKDLIQVQSNTSTDTKRRRLPGKQTYESTNVQRNMNGLSAKVITNKNYTNQGREFGTINLDSIPPADGMNGRGKFGRGGFISTQMPRLNRQLPQRPLFNNIPLQSNDDGQQRAAMNSSWSGPSTPEQSLVDSSVKRLNEMGYVQSPTQPGHFEKSEQEHPPHMNGGWQHFNPCNINNRQLSFHPNEAPVPYHNMVGSNFRPPSEHIPMNVQHPVQLHQKPLQQQQQQYPIMGPHHNSFDFEPYQIDARLQHQLQMQQERLAYAEYEKQQAKYIEQMYNNGPEYFPLNAQSPFSSPKVYQSHPQPQQYQQGSAGAAWRKPVQNNVGESFASVLKRIENDAKEPPFGPFTQVDRTNGSPNPWIWGGGGESDRSESGSGGARPSPEVFFQPPVRNQFMENENTADSRSQSCDSALVNPGIGTGIGSGARVDVGSPFSNAVHTNVIRRPTPTFGTLFGSSPRQDTPLDLQQGQHSSTAHVNNAGSPSPGVGVTLPEWDSSMKLGTFWSSHKIP